MKLEIYNFLDKSVAGSEDFDIDVIANIKINEKIIQDHFVKMKKNHFIPTAYTKCRAEMSATTKKPFKQKGTGNARQGTTVGAQHRGGVKIFGPRGIKAKISLPKKEVKLVKTMLLKLAIESNKLFVIKDCKLLDHKTKNSIKTLKAFNVTKGNTIILHDNEIEQSNVLSCRNLEWLLYSRISDFTVHNLMRSECVLITVKSMKKLVELL